MNQVHVGEYISQLRKKKGLTQIKLGEVIGVSDRTVSKWETGEGLPDVSILPSLAVALDTSVDGILNGGPMPFSKAIGSLGTKKDIARVKLAGISIISIFSTYTSLKLLYGYLSAKQQLITLSFKYGVPINDLLEMSSEVNNSLFDLRITTGIILLLSGFACLIYNYYKMSFNKELDDKIQFSFLETILTILWGGTVIFVFTYEILPLFSFVDLRILIFIATVLFILFILYKLKALLNPNIKITEIINKIRNNKNNTKETN